MAGRQVKTGERVTDHGEVFATEQKVNVRQDPATGNEKDWQPHPGYKTMALAGFEVGTKKRSQVAHLQ